jgi:hypothetical protein
VLGSCSVHGSKGLSIRNIATACHQRTHQHREMEMSGLLQKAAAVTVALWILLSGLAVGADPPGAVDS